MGERVTGKKHHQGRLSWRMRRPCRALTGLFRAGNALPSPAAAHRVCCQAGKLHLPRHACFTIYKEGFEPPASLGMTTSCWIELDSNQLPPNGHSVLYQMSYQSREWVSLAAHPFPAGGCRPGDKPEPQPKPFTKWNYKCRASRCQSPRKKHKQLFLNEFKERGMQSRLRIVKAGAGTYYP